MTKPRILIVGGAGLLGLNWAQKTKTSHDTILGVNLRRPNLSNVVQCQADFSSRGDVDRAVEETRPDIIINAAGLTSVEACEQSPDKAKLMNADLPAYLSAASSSTGCQLVHISTDHLFDDSRAPYSEEDVPQPLNVYARTKAMGEELVLKANPRALVLRTNFFAWGPSYRPSFSDWIYNELAAGQSVGLFSDVSFSPLSAGNLIAATHELLDADQSGIFNLSADDIVSKHQFGLLMANEFKLDKNLIFSRELSEVTDLVRRPRLMGLVNKKVCRVLGQNLGSVHDQILELKRSQCSPETKEVQQQ